MENYARTPQRLCDTLLKVIIKRYGTEKCLLLFWCWPNEFYCWRYTIVVLMWIATLGTYVLVPFAVVFVWSGNMPVGNCCLVHHRQRWLVNESLCDPGVCPHACVKWAMLWCFELCVVLGLSISGLCVMNSCWCSRMQERQTSESGAGPQLRRLIVT